MRLINYNSTSADIQMSCDELQVIHNSLEEVCKQIDEFEFETRLGYYKKVVLNLCNSLDDIIKSENPADANEDEDNNLLWLISWYYNQGRGGFGNGFEIKMGTLDNLGCSLNISLVKTEMQNKGFKNIDINRSEHDWIYCFVQDNVFKGYGGPFNLPEVLQIFRNWVENRFVYEDE